MEENCCCTDVGNSRRHPISPRCCQMFSQKTGSAACLHVDTYKNGLILTTCLHFLKSGLKSNPGGNARVMLKHVFFPKTTLGVIGNSVKKHHLL